MIKEFQAFFTLFQQGKSLTNSATWKSRTIAVNTLSGVLGAAIVIASGFGYKIEISSMDIETLSAGIVAAVSVFNAVMTVITSNKVGIKPKKVAGEETLTDRPTQE